MQRSRQVVQLPAVPASRRTAETRVFDYKGVWVESVSGSANWYVGWYDPEKRVNVRRSLRTTDLDAAKKHVVQIGDQHERDLQDQAKVAKAGKTKRQAPEDVLLHPVLDWYWDVHGQHTKSAGTNKERLDLWRAFFADTATLADLERADIDKFVKHLRDTHQHSDSTIDRTLVIGRAAINLYREYGLVTWVPKIKMVQTQEQREAAEPLGRPLEIEELAKLFIAQPVPHVRHLMWIMLGTLARPGAVMELAKRQVDPKRDRIDMNPPGRIQTKKRRPVLPLVPYLSNILNRIENARSRELDEGSAETFFYVVHKGHPIKSAKTSFRKMVINAGFAEEVESEGDDQDVKYDREPITPYSIRHTMARELRAAGFSLDDVGDYLGHKGKKGVTAVYAPEDPRYMKGQAEVVDAYMRRLEDVIARLSGVRARDESGTVASKFASKFW